MAQSDISQPRQQALPPAGFVLLGAITLFWGTNWPFMKIVVSEVEVLWFRTGCLVGGGTGLLLIALASGNSIRVPRRQISMLLISAVFVIIGWHLFSAYGLQLIPAGRATIIAFTMPIWTALLSSFVLGEALTKYKIIGLLFGICGLGALIGPDLIVFKTAPIGAFFMLMASISWAIGTVIFKRVDWETPIVSVVGWQLAIGAVPITIAAFMLKPLPDFAQISTQAYFAFAYVLALPILFCQWAYLKTVKIFPASIAAIGTLAIPVVSVYSSMLILGEPIGIQEIAALILIVLALVCVLVLGNRRQSSSNPT